MYSSRVLDALVGEAGWPRERAYRAVQQLAAAARDGEGSFRDLVETSPVGEALRRADVDLAACFDPAAFLRWVDVTFERLGMVSEVAGVGEPSASPPALAVEAGLGGGDIR